MWAGGRARGARESGREISLAEIMGGGRENRCWCGVVSGQPI